MNYLALAVVGIATMSGLVAQEQSDTPYQEGGVHGFLDAARERGRPSIVLFNFDLESG